MVGLVRPMDWRVVVVVLCSHLFTLSAVGAKVRMGSLPSSDLLRSTKARPGLRGSGSMGPGSMPVWVFYGVDAAVVHGSCCGASL